MNIFSRFRKSIRSANTALPPRSGEPEQMSFAAEIPGATADAPLWRVNLQVVSEPHGDGEKLRLRAHFQTNFASALRPALTGTHKTPAINSTGGSPLTMAQRTSDLAQRAFSNPVLQRLAAPLLKHDFNTWIDVQASTASLDEGVGALLPQNEKLTAMGIVPSRRKSGGPIGESWSGQSPNGFAQVSIVQIDKSHLPQRVAALLQGRPFQMAAAIVNTVEEK
ncbi:MAG: hypothetical protein ACRETW_12505 [Stenotrophobium sp.]